MMSRTAHAFDTFTWQGKLVDGGVDADGVYDLKFRLFDAAAGPAQVGGELIVDDVLIAEGLLMIDLDFGAGAFPGAGRWLEIDLKGDADGVYTTLAPRQPIHAVPYAFHSASTASVPSSALSGVYSESIDLTNAGNSFSGTFSGSGSALTGIDWDNISLNMPPAFADGVDDDTTYNAGTGLSLVGTTFSLGLHTHSADDITSGTLNIARMPTGGSWNLSTNLQIFGSLASPTPIARFYNGFDEPIGINLDTDFQSWMIGQNRPPDDDLQVDDFFIYDVTDGVTRLLIDDTGDVGLGTTSPVNRLDVEGGAVIGTAYSGTEPAPLNGLLVQGNVGIGTTTPISQLDVAGTVSSSGASGGSLRAYNPNNQGATATLNWLNDVARIRIGGTGAGSQNGFDIQTTGDDSLLRVLHNGNVGIGTTSPAAKLHVTGGETILEQEAWQTPTLLNGWVNYGSIYAPAAYFKDSTGVVHLRGLVKFGSIGTAVFVLPIGYRPEYRGIHTAVCSPSAFCRVDVETNGEVTVQTGNNAFVSLEGITFRAQ